MSLCSTSLRLLHFSFFFFNDTATTEIYTLSLHDALPICCGGTGRLQLRQAHAEGRDVARIVPEIEGRQMLQTRSEEHTSELQSRENLVCRLLLEKKKIKKIYWTISAGKTRDLDKDRTNDQ